MVTSEAQSIQTSFYIQLAKASHMAKPIQKPHSPPSYEGTDDYMPKDVETEKCENWWGTLMQFPALSIGQENLKLISVMYYANVEL